MPLPVQRLFVHGFPGLYGGAGTELHHQILAWRHMGLGVHLVPTDAGWRNEALLREMLGLGVVVHEADDFGAVEAGDPVLGFCNAEFLAALPRIRESNETRGHPCFMLASWQIRPTGTLFHRCWPGRPLPRSKNP